MEHEKDGTDSSHEGGEKQTTQGANEGNGPVALGQRVLCVVWMLLIAACYKDTGGII